MTTFSRPQVEHYSGDIIGAPFFTPRLTWNYDVEPQPDSMVRITAVRSVMGMAEHTETAIVPAEKSVLIDWPLSPLMTLEKAVVTLQLLDSKGKEVGEPSEPVTMETGLGSWERNADFVGPSWTEPQTDHLLLPPASANIFLH